MLRVNSLTFQYNTQKQFSFPDVELQQGEHCLLLGESGSGKTTFLHLVGGLLKAQSGVVEIKGTNLETLSESRLDKFRGQHIGFIFQRNHLVSALNVKQNLRLASFLSHAPMADGQIEKTLESLGIEDKLHAGVKTLSQGQAQRVAIARAVVNKPYLILADEPTSALDDTNCERVISLLLETSKQVNAILLISTHDQRLKSIIPNQIHLQKK